GLVSHHKVEAPALVWRNGNGRKVSGGDIVGTSHFPDDWQGKLIVGGYINNAVWSLNIIEDGAGFALEDFKPLITTTNRTFRPVDVKFGPDGALYICDWYNPIIGHYQASFRHPDRDKTHGRIWRVTAKGRPLPRPPDLANAASVVGAWADRLTNALSLLRPLASDPHPRVRLQAIVASTYVASSDAIEIAAIASEHLTDRFLEYALNQAVFALKPYWLPTLKPGPHLRMLVRCDRTSDTLQALRALPRDPAVL